MTRKISISLTDRGSIKDAIKQIKDYEKDLEDKTKLFLEKLADKGILVAELSAMGDSHKFSEMVKFEKEWQGQKLCLIGRNDDLSGLRTKWYDADGKYHNDIISPILMLEYGSAGLALNGHGGEYAKTGNHVNDTSWYFYEEKDKNGNPIKPHYATAEEAHAPMLKAWEHMLFEIKATAKEVWK